ISFCKSDQKSMPVVGFLTHNGSGMFCRPKLGYIGTLDTRLISCLQHVDGKVDLQSPCYTVILQPLTSLATVKPSFTIQISDMGRGQYFRRECQCCSALTSPISASLTLVNTTTPISPIALHAPKLILTESWDVSIEHLELWVFSM